MNDEFRLIVVFYKTHSGNEPVREWLKNLTHEEKKIIGEDIKTVQFGWPLGMPLIRKLESNLWEVRNHLKDRIARVLFTIVNDNMVLLHGFIKKSQKTLQNDIDLAKKKTAEIRSQQS
jgi:phage-related protein